MRTLFDNLKRWLRRPSFSGNRKRWPSFPSRRILVLSAAALLAIASLTAFGVYASMSDSGDSSATRPATNIRPSASPRVQATPVETPQTGELVATDTGPSLPETETPAPSDTSTPGGDSQQASAPTPAPVAPVNNGTRLIVEALGIDAPVITLGLDANAIPEVPLTGYEVAWYNFSAAPGTSSNAVFSGHVTWGGGKPAVFYYLPQLSPGSTIKVVTADGIVLTYEVFKNVLVSETDVWVMAPTSEPIITLITCGGTWVPDSSERFGGDYTGRTVVQARLVSGG